MSGGPPAVEIVKIELRHGIRDLDGYVLERNGPQQCGGCFFGFGPQFWMGSQHLPQDRCRLFGLQRIKHI